MPHLHQSLLRKRFSMRQVWIWITDIAPKYWVASALDASVVILSRAVGEFMPALHEMQASAMELICVIVPGHARDDSTSRLPSIGCEFTFPWRDAL